MKVPKLIQFEYIGDQREGFLSISHQKNIPFDIKRVFWTYHTPVNIMRGKHAHKDTFQILIALNGVIFLELTDVEHNKTQYVLDNPNEGILIPPNYWRTMKYSKDTIQLVLASTEYSKEGYLRDYNEFVNYWKQKLK